MNTLEQDIFLKGTKESIINELTNLFNGKSTIQDHQLTVYEFIYTSLGVDLDIEFVGQTNEMIQEYFGGTSIILKIAEIPCEIDENYMFKMIVHYSTIAVPNSCAHTILQSIDLLRVKQWKLIKNQEYEKACEIRNEINQIEEQLKEISTKI